MKWRNAAQTPDRWKVMSDPLGASNGAQKSRPAVKLDFAGDKISICRYRWSLPAPLFREADRSPMKLYNKPGGRKMPE